MQVCDQTEGLIIADQLIGCNNRIGHRNHNIHTMKITKLPRGNHRVHGFLSHS